MTFCIITHVPHLISKNQYFAYAPYVNEMNKWTKEVETLIIVAPETSTPKTAIDAAYQHQNIHFLAVKSFELLSLKSILKTIFKLPKICFQIFKAMSQADHIHLRCPGNMGLLGCIIQIVFPQKKKTAKYAGNWDPKSKQPWSYRLQKWILSNTFLTRSITVLVYGDWKGKTKNIKPFFTATYTKAEELPLIKRAFNGKINFVFVGTLVKGKNPLYAVQLVEKLLKDGYSVTLDLYGEGSERDSLENYISYNDLGKNISLKGSQNQDILKIAYQKSHFVILPSASEGWPKAIAEGMFWGSVPLATPVSCVPFMLDHSNRGLLLKMKLLEDVLQIEALLQNQEDYNNRQINAALWSRNYTLEVFQTEIKKLLQS